MKIHSSYNGAGRPVLVTCKPEHETLADSGLMIIIPRVAGFGAATYFRGEYKISHKVFCDEYDGCYCGYEYDSFQQATDEVLLKHLEDAKINPEFCTSALELIKECPLD